jgi:hypothetical protein
MRDIKMEDLINSDGEVSMKGINTKHDFSDLGRNVSASKMPLTQHLGTKEKTSKPDQTRKVSDHTNNGRSTSQAEFSSSSTSEKKHRVITNTTLPYTLSTQKTTSRVSKRPKNIVSYRETIDSGLESNATDSKDSDEYKLDPEEDIEDKSITADSKSESESEDEEVTKPSATIRPSIVTRPSAATKPSSTRPSDATKPSATTKSSTDKEKRATNKRIKDEVLRLMPQFKAELGEPLQSKHWGKLISQMENVDKYTKWLFFDKSNYCKHWRNKLTKAQKIMEIGIIGVKKGGRALGESSAWAATSAIEVAKRVTYTHTLRLSDDDADYNVAMGQVISILEALRGGKNLIIPSALTAYFVVGNLNKAWNMLLMIMTAQVCHQEL